MDGCKRMLFARRPELAEHSRARMAWLIGPGSTVDFELRSEKACPCFSCDCIDVDVLFDLSGIHTDKPAIFKLHGEARECSMTALESLRLPLVRYGSVARGGCTPISKLIQLDVSELRIAVGNHWGQGSLVLINAQGHGGSGSIQLLTRPTADRMLKAFPRLYST